MDNLIIVNGSLNSEKSLILDNGYNFGRGVFETILVKQQPLFLERHCERLKRGLRKLNIKSSVDSQYILKCIKQHKISECVLKVIVSEKNVVLCTRDITYTHDDYENGLGVRISDLRRNPYSHTTYIKSLNYLDNILEKEKAGEDGYGEVMFLNTNNELAEGSVSNVFFVKQGKLLTPEIGCGILDGIVRAWVIEEFEVSQGRYSIEDFLQAEEVFITNCVMGIMRVSHINGVCLPKKNWIYSSVRNKYEAFIDFHKPIAKAKENRPLPV
ncbi:MAG: aminotransferase class IV [Anaerocolumna sp.]